MSKITDIIHLIHFLDGDSSKSDKVLVIKQSRDQGIITSDEALDLAIEYFT